MREPNKKRVEVAAAVVVRGGRVLIGKRKPGAQKGGKWEFPGGKIRRGEDPPAALRREIREELGIAVEVGGLLRTIDHDYGGRKVRVRFFRCRAPAAGDFESLAHESLAWALPQELPAYDFLEADRKFVAQLSRVL